MTFYGTGERAIRAHLKATRAAAKKPSSLNEAVSNRMDEVLARKDAETSLTPPGKLVQACGEAIRPQFRLNHIVDTLQKPNMIGVVASEHRLDLAACVGSRVAESAVDAAESAQAENSLEKMLCHQMAAIHRAAMKLVARSLDMHDEPIEMARLSNAAARAMQVYQEGLLTLQKLRTGGKQTVVVQHVQVSDGGQAVITGRVTSGGRSTRSNMCGNPICRELQSRLPSRQLHAKYHRIFSVARPKKLYDQVISSHMSLGVSWVGAYSTDFVYCAGSFCGGFPI